MNTYTIHNGAVAHELQMRGFKLVKVEPNKKKPQFSVYHFEDSLEFQESLTEIMLRRRERKK